MQVNFCCNSMEYLFQLLLLLCLFVYIYRCIKDAQSNSPPLSFSSASGWNLVHVYLFQLTPPPPLSVHLEMHMLIKAVGCMVILCTRVCICICMCMCRTQTSRISDMSRIFGTSRWRCGHHNLPHHTSLSPL